MESKEKIIGKSSNKHLPTRDDMLECIYEVIADKTLSLGCMYNRYQDGDDYQWDDYNMVGRHWQYTGEEPHLGSIKIVGHPVMIGNVLDFVEKLIKESTSGAYMLSQKRNEITFSTVRKNKLKPIEDQCDNCVMLVYSLLPAKQ